MANSDDFPGDQVAKTSPSIDGVQVLSLVRKLRARLKAYEKKTVCGGGEVDGENFEKRDVLVTKPLSLITGSWVIGLSLGKQGEIVGRATGRNSGERYREGG